MLRVFLSMAVVMCLLTSTATAQSPSRPNIVYLMADDHAAHALSAYRDHLAYGAALPDTPNLDRLAASGMLFTNAFVTNSICTPSRATLLTGQYGHLNGVMTNADALPPGTVTFPGLLQANGYQTALFGKWHLRTPPEGFTHYETLVGQGPYYNPRLGSSTDTTEHTGYTNDILTRRALDWVEAQHEAAAPFLMMLHFNAPHRYWDAGPDALPLFRDTLFAEPATFWDEGKGRAFATRDAEMTVALDLFDRDLKLESPNNLTPEQQALWDTFYDPENTAFHAQSLTGDALTRWKYQRYIQDYMRAVLGIDKAVGQVLDALDALGLADNTVVVYTSDQGFFLGDHGWFDKRWMYEESLRIPLLVRWPGVVEAGSVNRDLVMNLDFAQTFLDLGQTAAPETMQGASLVPLLRGQRPGDWRDALYYHYHAYPDWHMVPRHYGLRTDRYKLIHYYEADRWELFDLMRDPGELRSLYADPAYATTVQALETRLHALQQQYAVPASDPAPHIPFDTSPDLRRPPGERPPIWGQ